MNIYVLRHGQTDYNFEKRMLGTTDIHLNDTGVTQANNIQEIISKLDYDIVFCSPLLRTKETCEIVNIKNVKVIYDKRIVEYDMGIIEGLKVNEFDYASYWKLNRDKYDKEETFDNLMKRVYSFLDEIKKEYKDKNILIVTHNGVCRVIKSYFDGIPKDQDLKNYGQDNSELKIYLDK